MPTALVTGITGQDGSYLAEFLLSKGYTVIGMSRRTSTVNFERIAHIQNEITLVQGDLHDQSSLVSILEEYEPDEVYNLGAQSFVPASWQQAVLTAEVTAIGVLRMLESIRQVDKKIRFYQASSSEMFGKVMEVPQRESTPFYPRSPYGVAKVYGHWITINYRESYNLFTNLLDNIKREVISILFKFQIRTQEEVDALEKQRLQQASYQSVNYTHNEMKSFSDEVVADNEEEAASKTVVNDRKIGRNEPCPCGSSKKYKQCHGAFN